MRLRRPDRALRDARPLRADRHAATSPTIADPDHRRMVAALTANAAETGVTLFDLDDSRQGIVHVVGPEQGLTQPGMTLVCGDSHTSTHGALGALAFGIGSSEVTHVLATQTPVAAQAEGDAHQRRRHARPGITAKDVILAIIAQDRRRAAASAT